MKVSNLIFTCLLFVSALVYGQDQPMLLLSGTITDLDPEDKVEFIFGDKTNLPIDLQDGKFELKYKLPENGSAIYMSLDGPKGFRYAYFYLGNETAQINASALDFNSDIRAVGSSLDSLRYIAHMQTKPVFEQLDALAVNLQQQMKTTANVDSLQSVFKIKKSMLVHKLDSLDAGFVLENINTPYGIHSLKFSLPNLSKTQIEDLLARVDQKYQDTPEISFASLYAQYPELEVSDLFYDFNVLDQNNNPVNFKDQFDGRYVVLDFSHPYCGFCRLGADSLNKLSEELGDKVNLFSVMNDNDKRALEEFKKLRLAGSNVYYAEKAYLDPVVAKYKVSGTPTYFVFSPKGELLLQHVGYKEDLQGFIENHSKNNPISYTE